MDGCIFGNLNITKNNIKLNNNTKTNETMIFMKILFTYLINHYSNVTIILINSGNNKLVNKNNTESSNESLSIIEK